VWASSRAGDHGLHRARAAGIRCRHEEPTVPTQPPDTDAPRHEAPAAPAIPSFDSLRDPRRRTAFDLLVPDGPPAQAPVPVPVAAARPPDYADLLRLGVHLAQAAAAVPVRLARWSLRRPVTCLRRLLGD